MALVSYLLMSRGSFLGWSFLKAERVKQGGALSLKHARGCWNRLVKPEHDIETSSTFQRDYRWQAS